MPASYNPQMPSTYNGATAIHNKVNLNPQNSTPPKGLQYLYSLNPYVLLALGTSNSPCVSAIKELGLTHVIRVEYERKSGSTTKTQRRGSYRNERDELTNTDTLILTIPPPPPTSPMTIRTETCLTPRQLAAARDFLHLALPFQRWNTYTLPTDPADSSRVLLVAPAWHVVRETVSPFYGATEHRRRWDSKCYIDMGEDFDPCGPFIEEICEDTPPKGELRVVRDHSVAADLVAIVICYISYISSSHVGKVAKNLEEELWMNGGRPDISQAVSKSTTFHRFKAPGAWSSQVIDARNAKRPRFEKHFKPDLAPDGPTSPECVPAPNASKPAGQGVSKKETQPKGNTTKHSKMKPKYLEKRPGPIFTSPSTEPDHYSLLPPILPYQDNILKPLPSWTLGANAIFWTSRISETGLMIAHTGVHADARDPKVVERLTAMGFEAEGPPGWL
ncbi:hypothetical protein BJ165DRAFT_1574603 [Panaeolus papilionaceus]|nr:hypothetical protein BJ165DRAFT_1574603 [Panaeolus papilionaceus]